MSQLQSNLLEANCRMNEFHFGFVLVRAFDTNYDVSCSTGDFVLTTVCTLLSFSLLKQMSGVCYATLLLLDSSQLVIQLQQHCVIYVLGTLIKQWKCGQRISQRSMMVNPT